MYLCTKKNGATEGTLKSCDDNKADTETWKQQHKY